MIYREHPPQRLLKGYIECFWVMTSPSLGKSEPQDHRVLPDCCSDIIFDFTGVRNRSPSYVVGTMTRPVLFTTGGPVDLLGIRFKPGGLRPFLNVPLGECTDLAADLECFWGPAGSELWSQLVELKDSVARIALIETHLLKKYGWCMGLDPYVQHCVRVIESQRGQVTSKELERGTGLSARQIERKFNRDIGVGPKVFSRIVRFQEIIRCARLADHPDWSDIAFEHGYADQSHLVRESKEFSGLSPSSFGA